MATRYQAIVCYRDDNRTDSLSWELEEAETTEEVQRAMLRLLNLHRRYTHVILGLAINALTGGEWCEECRGGYEPYISPTTGKVITCPRCHDKGYLPTRSKTIMTLGNLYLESMDASVTP